MNNWRRVFATFFVYFLLLNSTFALAYSPENFEETPAVPQMDPDPYTLEFQPVPVNVPTTVSFRCENYTLSPEESQKFLDNVLRSGLYKKMSAGEEAIPLDQREKLESCVLKTDSQGRMHKVCPGDDEGMNDREITQKEIANFLNKGIDADAFSFGLVLDDTKRVGRCKDLDENVLCPVEEQALFLRNSGEGIVEDMAPMWEGIQGLFRKGGQKLGFIEEKTVEELNQENYDEMRKAMGLPPDNDVSVALSSKIVMADDAVDQLMHFRRKVSDENHAIHNTLQAESFKAKFATNCNVSGSSCTISVYSMFDKYYNQWFSSIMVLSTFAPALLHRAGKLVTQMSYSGEVDLTFGKWPWSRPVRRMAEWWRSKLYDPYGKFTKLAQARGGRIYANMEKYPEIGKAINPLLEPGEWTSKYLLTKGTEFRQWFRNDFLSKGGFLDEIAKQPRKVRKTFLKTVKDLRALSRTQASLYWRAKRSYLRAYERYGYGSAEEVAARIKYGIDAGKAARGYDATIRLDLGEWMVQKDESADLYHYFLKAKGEERFIPVYRDPAQLNMLESKFWKDGHFGGHWPSSETSFMPETYESVGKNLKLYEVKPGKFYDHATPGDIHSSPQTFRERVVQNDKGQFMKADHGVVGHLKSNAGPKVKVYEMDGFTPARDLKPEEFAEAYLTRRAEMTTASEPWRNSEQMYNSLLRRGFSGRNYGSWLDKAFSEEDELIKAYFNPMGGMKKTAQMYGYWYMKKGEIPGVLDLDYSGYMKETDFKKLSFPLGHEEIYNDAFIDFFAQAGSDQGDVFQRALSYLPWDLVLNAATEKFDVASDAFQSLTGKGIRYKVENIVDFVNSPKGCLDCFLGIDKNTTKALIEQRPDDVFAFNYYGDSPIKSDMLEFISSDKRQVEGTTLIAFARHTNIAGDEIFDLAKAQRKQGEFPTCVDAVKEMTHGIPVVSSFLSTSNVGASLAFGESLGYYIFGLSGGLFGTAFQQIYLAPKLQECIDTEGGYYAQISAPAKELDETQAAQREISELTKEIKVLENLKKAKKDEKVKLAGRPQTTAITQRIAVLDNEIDSLNGQIDDKKSDIQFIQEKSKIKGKSVGQLSTEKLFDSVKDFQANVMTAFGGSNPREALGGLNNQVKNFLKSNEVDDMVQATVESQGHAVGREEGPILFDLWWKGEAASTKLPEEGKVVFEPDFGPPLTKDYAKGSLTATGDSGELIEIINKPESKLLLQMERTNTRAAAEEIGHKGTRMTTPNDLTVMFEYKNTGQFIVRNTDVLGCIQQGVLEQTAVPLTGNDLVEVFGSVKDVRTDAGYHIHATKNKMFASGNPSLSVSGADARAEIFGTRTTILKNSHEKKTGKMISVMFEHGEILYNPRSDELIVLLRRNAQALLHQSDVAGLQPTLTSDTNPLNGCPEPAIDLTAIPIPGSSLKAVQAGKFNDSMKSAGPFKVFETPTKRYIFYSELVDGQCVDKFKVIDKETGQTLFDGPIKPGTLKQTPTGVEFETEDGKKHKLDFSAEDGIPKISYNNQPAETLTAAQGRNGSFWYDPESGMWYPENGHLIPLIEAFRNGAGTRIVDGKAAMQAANNWQSLEVSTGANTPFNLPSLPSNPLMLFLFIALMLASITFSRIRIQKESHKK